MARMVKKLVAGLVVSLGLLAGIGSIAEAVSQPKPKRYTVDVPNSGIDVGAAKVNIDASPDMVKKAVLDFNDYSSMISKFKRSKIIGKKGAFTDVYLQVPILKGLAKVWAVVRFAPPKQEGKTVVVKGKMVKGNVDELNAEWRILPLSQQKTELHLLMRIVPKIPAPGGLVTGEVAYAADEAVKGIRAATEGR